MKSEGRVACNSKAGIALQGGQKIVVWVDAMQLWCLCSSGVQAVCRSSHVAILADVILHAMSHDGLSKNQYTKISLQLTI